MADWVWVALGAVLGALLRWRLGVWLNPMCVSVALGTLLVNWLGCFVMGMFMAVSLDQSSRWLLISGFMGSFTTFSAEVVNQFMHQKWATALGLWFLHGVGSVVLTALGACWMTVWRR